MQQAILILTDMQFFKIALPKSLIFTSAENLLLTSIKYAISTESQEGFLNLKKLSALQQALQFVMAKDMFDSKIKSIKERNFLIVCHDKVYCKESSRFFNGVLSNIFQENVYGPVLLFEIESNKKFDVDLTFKPISSESLKVCING